MDANCVAIQVPRLSVCLSVCLLDVLWWFTDWLNMRQNDVQYVQIWHGYFCPIYVRYALICLGYFRPTEQAESSKEVSKVCSSEVALILATGLPATEHSEGFLARGPPSPESLSHFLPCRSTGAIQQNHAVVCVRLQTGESPCRLKHTHVNCYEEFVNWVVFSPNFNLNN